MSLADPRGARPPHLLLGLLLPPGLGAGRRGLAAITAVAWAARLAPVVGPGEQGGFDGVPLGGGVEVGGRHALHEPAPAEVQAGLQREDRRRLEVRQPVALLAVPAPLEQDPVEVQAFPILLGLLLGVTIILGKTSPNFNSIMISLQKRLLH